MGVVDAKTSYFRKAEIFDVVGIRSGYEATGKRQGG